MSKALGVVVVTALLACPGCGSGVVAEDLPARAPAPKTEDAVRSDTVGVVAASADATVPDSPVPKPEAPRVAPYEPPFPDRQDPFKAPQPSSRAARRSQGSTSSSVELLGFAKVDEPSAVLSIDGEVRVIPEGGSAMGVDVLQIAPPRAVLKRGRTRWTATIE